LRGDGPVTSQAKGVTALAHMIFIGIIFKQNVRKKIAGIEITTITMYMFEILYIFISK